MELPFTTEEVLYALTDMNGDKAPGPDGFTIAFWQSSWEVVKDDVMRMFKEFYELGKFVKSLNNSFIVMIPKKKGGWGGGGGGGGCGGGGEDLRPISFVGSLHKLLTKVLANGLKRVMDKLVNRA